jgi:hypothetical protein
VIVIASFLTASCGVREVFIQGKQAPDEFAVYSRAPLSIPPEYKLRVPDPGSKRPQEIEPGISAQKIILGSISPSATDLQVGKGASGLQSFLRDASALNTDPAIRDLIDRETSVLAMEDGTVIERIMFWNSATDYGLEVDPKLENKRLQENQALGQPLTTGDVPTIERRRKSLLDNLF